MSHQSVDSFIQQLVDSLIDSVAQAHSECQKPDVGAENEKCQPTGSSLQDCETFSQLSLVEVDEDCNKVKKYTYEGAMDCTTQTTQSLFELDPVADASAQTSQSLYADVGAAKRNAYELDLGLPISQNEQVVPEMPFMPTYCYQSKMKTSLKRMGLSRKSKTKSLHKRMQF